MADPLARQLRAGPVVAALAACPDPHLQWLDLLWGPHFDRAQALGLAARLPAVDAPVLLAAADRFDALAAPTQQRLRRLILRHRLLRIGHAPHPAD